MLEPSAVLIEWDRIETRKTKEMEGPYAHFVAFAVNIKQHERVCVVSNPFPVPRHVRIPAPISTPTSVNAWPGTFSG